MRPDHSVRRISVALHAGTGTPTLPNSGDDKAHSRPGHLFVQPPATCTKATSSPSPRTVDSGRDELVDRATDNDREGEGILLVDQQDLFDIGTVLEPLLLPEAFPPHERHRRLKNIHLTSTLTYLSGPTGQIRSTSAINSESAAAFLFEHGSEKFHGSIDALHMS